MRSTRPTRTPIWRGSVFPAAGKQAVVPEAAQWATDLDDLLGQLGSAAEASGAGRGEDDFA